MYLKHVIICIVTVLLITSCSKSQRHWKQKVKCTLRIKNHQKDNL